MAVTSGELYIISLSCPFPPGHALSPSCGIDCSRGFRRQLGTYTKVEILHAFWPGILVLSDDLKGIESVNCKSHGSVIDQWLTQMSWFDNICIYRQCGLVAHSNKGIFLKVHSKTTSGPN